MVVYEKMKKVNQKRVYFLVFTATMFIAVGTPQNISNTEKILNNAINLKHYPAAESAAIKDKNLYLIIPAEKNKKTSKEILRSNKK